MPLKKSSSASLLSLLALTCMAAVISGLIIVNYVAQNSLHHANLERFQQNLEDRARSLEYFFSERENDIRSLAGSTTVTSFFVNRALGMTMAYGLRASLNNISRHFHEKVENSLLGNTAIYSSLLLIASNGEIMVQWPATSSRWKRTTTDLSLFEKNTVAITNQGNGLIHFTCPVFVNNQIQGFVQGVLQYRTFVNYLLRDLPGSLIITHNKSIAYHTFTRGTPTPALFMPLIDTHESPILIEQPQLGLQNSEAATNDKSTLFFAAIPAYAMKLLVLEDGSVLNQQRSQFYSFASLIVLSLAAFISAAFIFRAGAKRLILETSLQEANIRERAVAEKKEELELVLEGAQLGTWSWNPLDNQVECNERYWSMLGYSLGDEPDHLNDWIQLLHPEDAEDVVTALTSHAAGKSPVFSAEYRMRHKNGTWVWIQDIAKVVQKDSQGNALRAFGIHQDITQHKQAVALQGKAKQESDAIIRDFLDTLIVVNTYLTIIRVNQATCDLLGYDEKELLGRKVTEIFHDTPEHVQQAFAFYTTESEINLLTPQERRNVELCYRHKNGDRLPMSFNIKLLKNDEGNITGVVAGAKDISHLRRAMDKIGEQKEYIETLFDIIPSGLVALSPELQIVESNRAFRQLVETWANHFAIPVEECEQRFIDQMTSAQQEQDSFTIAMQQGHFRGYFRCNAVFIAVLQGVASVMSIEDITDERQAEEERRLLATVIEQTGDSIYISSIEELVEYVNPAAIHNSGYSEEELIGEPPLIFRDEQVDVKIKDELRQAMNEGKAWNGRFNTHRKDGTMMEEDATVSPVRNDAGELTHFVAIKRDVTELSNLQRQLLQAQKLEAIGQLAAGIAHELNTPMQYVQNNVSFFKQSFDELQPLLAALEKIEPAAMPSPAREELADQDLEFLLEEVPTSIQETLDGIDRVAKIVAAMKEFSHPGVQEREATDLNHTIENTLIVCRNEYKYDAELQTDFDEALPLVPCFPDQFNQVILNLIINATHAIQMRKAVEPELSGLITVTTRSLGSWVEILVTDNGTGIPGKVKARIFDPFFTTKEVGKGTGQGLTIAHDIMVNKHDGEITFHSIPGEGTTFALRLPLKPKQAS
ncbi:PAS domain S-box protein [Desulfobulbus rhabdoformis]|nr:PAS domain S-box protein [Desulfobulbus rhabdoformis]